MIKRKRDAFELAEPLQDVGENYETPKLAFDMCIFPFPSFNLPSRCSPVIYSDTSLHLAALSGFKNTLGIDKDPRHSGLFIFFLP